MLLRKFWNSPSVKSFTQMFFYQFKNSGKLKTETKNAAATLNISYYRLHKNHGTRFLNHRCWGLKNLLHNWPGLITGFENVLANDCESFKDTRAKIKEILIKVEIIFIFVWSGRVSQDSRSSRLTCPHFWKEFSNVPWHFPAMLKSLF